MAEKKLKSGFTTGTAAAAAAKGALSYLLEGESPSCVEIELLTGDPVFIQMHHCSLEGKRAICSVIKDAGDDPDITHQAEIGASVMLLDNGNQDDVVITGGKGVGRVTKPGLEISPGEPAINSGPRKMITQSVHDVLRKHRIRKAVEVQIFVPEGESLALKTLNSRLGIMGGISILGTTGIVRPMSHDAYIATIKSALSVAHAAGLDRVVLTTGRRSERYAQMMMKELPEEAFVQIGDFFKISLETASENGFENITLAIFFGKALKMAQGIPHTHAAKSALTMHKLSKWSRDITKDEALAQHILSANTARHALDLVRGKHSELISHVGKLVVQSAKSYAGADVRIRAVIFDYHSDVIFDYHPDVIFDSNN